MDQHRHHILDQILHRHRVCHLKIQKLSLTAVLSQNIDQKIRNNIVETQHRVRFVKELRSDHEVHRNIILFRFLDLVPRILI